MKAGPKRAIDAGPLDLSMLPAEGGARAVAFVETFLRIPKGRGAGQLVRLRPWQAEVVHGLYDDPRPRQGLVSMGRKNGKSLLAACLACYALFADGEEGAEVLVVAADERQARVVWNLARRMVELSPALAEQAWGLCRSRGVPGQRLRARATAGRRRPPPGPEPEPCRGR